MTLSIIVPVYQVVQYLPVCMESILQQTGFSFEVILVDDASTDGCAGMAQDYAASDSRVRYVRHACNKGLSAARNTGLSLATGKFVTFVDSDDYLGPDTLTVAIQTLLQHPEADVLEYPVQVYSGSPRHYTYIPSQEERVESFRDWVERGGYVHSYAWNKIYRRTLWDGISFPEGLYFEDLYTIPGVLQRARAICAVSYGCYYYCVRSTSITGQNSLSKQHDLFYAAWKMYRQFEQAAVVAPAGMDRVYLYVADRQIDYLSMGGALVMPSRRSVGRLLFAPGYSAFQRFKILFYFLIGRHAFPLFVFLKKRFRL